MSANKAKIWTWIESAQESNTHVLIVRDTFDNENYPVYVEEDEDANERVKFFNDKQMSKVDEVYNLKMDHKKQINSRRAWNI